MLYLTSIGPASAENSGTTTLNDRLDLMAATTLTGVTYGIMTALYCITTHALLKKLFRRNIRSGSNLNSLLKSKLEWRKTLFYTVYTTILFILATLYTAANSQNAIVAYVDNRLYAGGPYEYYTTYMTGQPIMVMSDIVAMIILWMTDALILCRFVVFYHKIPYARWIIPLPCVMYVGVLVTSIIVLHGEAGLGKIFYLSDNLLIAYYALSFTLNVLTTALIAARLYWYKVQLERVFGTGLDSPYMSIATLLIESAALYGLWSITFLILNILQSPGQIIILATVCQIQVIAPLLIILWIARGKAWNNSKSYGENEDVSDQPPSSRLGRFSFGSRPTRVTGEFGMPIDSPSTCRNASWSTVVERETAKNGDDGMIIELGLYGSKPPSILGELSP